MNTSIEGESTEDAALPWNHRATPAGGRRPRAEDFHEQPGHLRPPTTPSLPMPQRTPDTAIRRTLMGAPPTPVEEHEPQEDTRAQHQATPE